MGERLPLFPLGTVLLPGLLMPLQIFEERYRVLVRELLEIPETETRRFGVVAIRRGREVGPAVPQTYDIGCTALVRRIEAQPDGKFSVVTVGGPRFRIGSVDSDSRPYLVGDVEFLDDVPGDEAAAANHAAVVTRLMREYTERLTASGTVEIRLPDMPTDPIALSYLIAAAVANDLAERQELLAAPDAATRLRAERALLRRELGLLERITTVGSSELNRITPSSN
ncbi:peptidase S16 [Parafrankia colletiae]|uniref:Peptidase S16 n=1 Tax=Parafrankia colletiae TaxID=573497 RepID=A0A1S1RDI4_9ACTN|nr:LON peptidase substrate-binding domain-containing protein [Parafrankia colletiae]MCK9900503.1 LON peptidase substrate-binding domain-containing protein [Frankia sp. Cpl3]OHV43292.1 peptidase S16 [Parafrankia colletiae]